MERLCASTSTAARGGQAEVLKFNLARGMANNDFSVLAWLHLLLPLAMGGSPETAHSSCTGDLTVALRWWALPGRGVGQFDAGCTEGTAEVFA